jgi:hypothetical protein
MGCLRRHFSAAASVVSLGGGDESPVIEAWEEDPSVLLIAAAVATVKVVAAWDERGTIPVRVGTQTVNVHPRLDDKRWRVDAEFA